MEKNKFWDETARYGAILGGILALSFILETSMSLSGRMSLYTLLGPEWIVVVVLHYYLLHRFTRQYSTRYSAEEGFSFGQGYAYLMAVSGFAGAIVGVVQAVYLHLVMGYENYTERMSAAITELLASGGEVPAQMEGMIEQLIDQMQSAATPSVLSTVWGGIFTSLLFGAFFGLIIAGVLSRAPRPFDTSDNLE